TSEWLKQIAFTKTVSEGELGAVGQVVIDARIEAVVVVAEYRRRNEVLKRHVSVRQRIERRNRATDRVNKEIGNDAALKWLLGEWVQRHAKQTLREIAAALFGRRHVADASNTFARTCAFVVGKEERSIAFNRAAKSSAKLIAKVFRFRFG